LILAELNGKKIGPQGTNGPTTGGGVAAIVTVVEQLLPGQALPQLVLSVDTFTETVIVPLAPVVSSVTSLPVVDDSVPPVVLQL